MSNTQEKHAGEEHQAIIKTPKQLITVVVLAFVVPILVIILLVTYVSRSISTAPGSDALTFEAVDARIAPIAGFELVDASKPREMLTGEAVYAQVCAACHDAGVAGAPKMGDSGEWAPRIAAGLPQMVEIALNGKGAMPPKGGATHLSDFEVERAVVYMANAAGANFDEPTAPAEGEAEEGTESAVASAPAAAETPTPAAPASPQPQASAAPVAAAPEAPAEQPAEQVAAAIQISPEADTVGKKIYETSCFACHGTGVANAPKIGDKNDWAPYIATGMDAMLQVAITGKGAMPPRGTAVNASDDELRLAIEYMIKDAL